MSSATLGAFRQYGENIWKARYFWFSLVKIDLRSRYRGSLLGLGWSLLHPIAMTAIVCVVFAKLFGVDPRTGAPAILAGFTFWSFLTNCVSGGSTSFVQSEAYIRQCPMPLAIYPLRIMLGAAFQFVIALCVVVSLIWLLVGFANLQYIWIVPPALLLILVVGWALATIMSVVNSFFPDSMHLSEVLLQIVFYCTPIIYPPEMLRARGLGLLIDLNPAAAMLEIVRQPLVYAQMPSMQTFVMAGVTSVVSISLAIAVMGRYERKIIFQL